MMLLFLPLNSIMMPILLHFECKYILELITLLDSNMVIIKPNADLIFHEL